MMRTRLVAALAVLVVAGCSGAPDEPKDAPGARPATAKVVRTDLSDYWSETGTVGYRRQRTLRGAAAGVVTWLPRSGGVVSRGGTLFRVNDRPVTLFYGSTPMFRDLGTPGTVGRDVRVLVANLRALGYRTGDQPATKDQDGVFTDALEAAVRRWQQDRDVRPADGVVRLGDVLVLPGQVRVGATTARLGDDATGDVMSVSDRAKAVSVEIDADRAGDVRAGQKVRITLPDGTTTTGTAGSVSTVVTTGQDRANEAPKVQVVVTVDQPEKIENITSADVEVRFTGTTVRRVLAVPVGALLALSGGGYGVQLDGGALIAVRVGLFADGRVQVEGKGLAEGASVVTTS